MTKLIVYGAIIAAAYWYWSGPYQARELQTQEEHLRENRLLMQRCLKQETSAGGLAGLAGMGGEAGEDARALCANKHDLVERDGQWHTKKAEQY